VLSETQLQTLLVVIVWWRCPPFAPTDTLVGDRTIEQRPAAGLERLGPWRTRW
jgi:hypothetical protein